jgi:hypothetical protein
VTQGALLTTCGKEQKYSSLRRGKIMFFVVVCMVGAFLSCLLQKNQVVALSLTDDNYNNLSYTIYQVHISCILVIILHHIIFKTETYYGQ